MSACHSGFELLLPQIFAMVHYFIGWRRPNRNVKRFLIGAATPSTSVCRQPFLELTTISFCVCDSSLPANHFPQVLIGSLSVPHPPLLLDCRLSYDKPMALNFFFFFLNAFFSGDGGEVELLPFLTSPRAQTILRGHRGGAAWWSAAEENRTVHPREGKTLTELSETM